MFINVFDDREAAVALGGGWHAGLEVLEATLDGRELDWSVWERDSQLKDEYAGSLAGV